MKIWVTSDLHIDLHVRPLTLPDPALDVPGGFDPKKVFEVTAP